MKLFFVKLKKDAPSSDVYSKAGSFHKDSESSISPELFNEETMIKIREVDTEEPVLKEEAPKESEEKTEEEKKKEEPEKVKLSKKELLDLTKAEQVTILEKLDAKKIPRYEKDRVALILKLQ